MCRRSAGEACLCSRVVHLATMCIALCNAPAKGGWPAEVAPLGYGISRQAMGGHADAVNCLDAMPGRPLLLSGSDDGTARIWDMRTLQCVLGFENGKSRDPVSSVAVSASAEHLLYAASGPAVLVFDLRMPAAEHPLMALVQDSVVSEHTLSFDISQISIHPSGSRLAAIDEGGDVSIVDISGTNPTQAVHRLENKHEALGSCVCWSTAPERSSAILTGGFDMKVMMHRLDVQLLRQVGSPVTLAMNTRLRSRPSPRANAASFFDKARKGAPVSGIAGVDGHPTINPPFVHALDLTLDGQTLVVACGDGSMRAYGIKPDGARAIFTRRDFQGHRLRTTCVALPRWSRQDRCLTGSDDRRLLLWDLAGHSDSQDVPIMDIEHGLKP